MKREAQENIQLLRVGQRTICPELYVLPKNAKIVHDEFVENMVSADWGFILVRGENGAGKSVYMRYLEHIANDNDLAISHIEIDPKLVKQYGPASYFTLQMLENVRLPDGEMMLYKMSRDVEFRRKLHGIIEKHYADFDYYNPALTQALLLATDDTEAQKELRKLAVSWLKGEPKYVAELKQMEILDRSMKSVLNVPTNKMLYLIKDLLQHTGPKGLLVSVDEIEKAGELPYMRGRETLSLMRDLINILTSEDSLPIRRGAMKGLFICYAISTFYLGYSGVIEVEGVDFRAQADQYGKPNVTIQEVPRLSTMLRESGSLVSADFSDLDDLEKIAEKIIKCYAHAKKQSISLDPHDLATEAFGRTNEYLARSNVMTMVKHLDRSFSG
jgi:hypothetical protein